MRSPAAEAHLLVSLRQGLNETNFVEGQNVAIEYRYAEGQVGRLPSLMADLIGRRVAVLVATGGVQAPLAAKQATTAIPIVFTTGGDPVQEGLVRSLNRPGGNLTGVTTSFGEISSKRLGLLREFLPPASIIGVLVNPDDPIPTSNEKNDLVKAARSIGQQIEFFQVTAGHDIDEAFAKLSDMRIAGLLVTPNSLFVTQADRLVALAERYKIPTLYWRGEFVEAGGLMSYGTSLADSIRVVGVYVGRILKGEKPGDLPVQLPTRFELVINLKTARTLGLTVPTAMIVLADRVIE